MKITLLTGKIFDIKEAIGIDIKIVQSKTSSKLILKIDAKERIPVLSIPKYCTRKRAINFINENMDWIIESLKKLPKIKYFEDKEKISLFGKLYTIIHKKEAKCGVMEEKDCLIVSGGKEFLHRRVKDYIKRKAETEFFNISSDLANRIGCKINSVCIKDTKSRWGSCSTLNNINYSWRIALAPDFVIKYLIAHEVAHLKHPDHSVDFWNCVEFLYNDWKKGHKWLQDNGKNLYVYK